MQKIGSITSTANASGEWTNGNVAAGTAPTIIDAAWLNTVQRELANVVTNAGLTLDPANDAQLLAALKLLTGPGRLLNTKVFTASGTYTPTAGTKTLRVRAISGGGGSGGMPATSASTGGISPAGYYGQYIDVTIPVTAFAGVQTILIGAGGTGGASGQTAGNSGGTTSFGSIFSLVGGPGGFAGFVSATVGVAGASTQLAAITSTITPNNSSGGISRSNTVVQIATSCVTGQQPVTCPMEGNYYGLGGFGTVSSPSTAALPGTAGNPGVMFIQEYS